MTPQEFHIYAAAFMDAEGSFCISRVRMGPYSDNHRLIIDIAQHGDRVDVLTLLQAEFGGKVVLKKQSAKSFDPGAHLYNWHLQRRQDVYRFVRTIQPYLLCKGKQAAIAIEFLETTEVKSKPIVGGNQSGRRFLAGTSRLTAQEIETREALRLKMREANTLSTRRKVATETD